MCTFLFFFISFWCASNSDCCRLLPECFSTRRSISLSRAVIVLSSSSWSASGLSPLKWTIHLTKLMSLHLYSYSFTVLPHMKQKCIILCDSLQIVHPSVTSYTKWPLSIQITKFVSAFRLCFDFPKNNMQPVQNMQVPYSVTFCHLLVHLTSKLSLFWALHVPFLKCERSKCSPSRNKLCSQYVLIQKCSYVSTATNQQRQKPTCLLRQPCSSTLH